MTNQPFILQPRYRRRLLAGQTLLWVLALVLGLSQPTRAQSATPGDVIGWGWNITNQVTIPAGLTGVTAVAAGRLHSIALKADGTITGWGDNTYGQVNIPGGLAGVTAIAAGSYHNLALKNNGTVVNWGRNFFGELNIPFGLGGVIAIDAGPNTSLALKNDGTVVGWGDNQAGQLDFPAGLTGVTAISGGDFHGLALKNDGTVVAWGYNGSGQTTVPAGLTGVTAIAAGSAHNLALKNDGTVIGWGFNNRGQISIPAGLTGVTAIAAGDLHSIALKSDGTVVAWGANNQGQLAIPAGLSGVMAIAASSDHNLAIIPSSDVTPPVITPNVAGTLGSNGWYTSDASVTWSVTDPESPVTSQSGCDAQSVTSDTAGVTFTCAATSGGGSNSQNVTVQRDATAPTISAAATTRANDAGWYNSNVTVHFTCGDNLSQVTSCPADQALSSEGDEVASAAQTIVDTAGNSSAASNVVTVNIDKSAPTLAPSVTPNPVPLNGTATASANASDATSGVYSQGCAVVDTASTGAKSVSCTATDNAGNTATAAANYTVNSPPTLAVAADGAACLSDSSAKGVIKLELGDADGGPSPLTLSLVNNSNTSLVPNKNAVLGSSGANRTLTVTAAAKKSGTALLTLRVGDGLNNTDLLVNVVVGTDKNETLNGTANTDMIFGLLGANTINGLGSNDLLCGGNGLDIINGGDGDDTLGGNRGNDVLNGEGGNDRLTGSQGADRFSGGGGTDSATDFTPSQGDTQEGVENQTVLAAGVEEAEITGPEITNQLFLPAIQN